MIGANGHPVLEPDRRYFRRKRNRHVHKERRMRKALRWTAILLSNAVAAGGLLWFGERTMRALSSSDEFSIRRIEIEGTRSTTPEAVGAVLRPLEGRNLLDLDLDEAARLATSDPWVRDATVKRVFPQTLRVTVRERRPAALALIGGVVQVVDELGTTMGPAGPGLAYDLPVITGLDGLDEGGRAAALVRGVGYLSRILQLAPSFVTEISEIDLSHPDRVIVVSSGDEPPLLLDPESIGRNLVRWIGMRSDIARRTGPLEYADLRWSSRIALKPRDDLFTGKNE